MMLKNFVLWIIKLIYASGPSHKLNICHRLKASNMVFMTRNYYGKSEERVSNNIFFPLHWNVSF
jgi:hypothetical protein